MKSFIHVRDVSRGELAVLEHGELGQIYHLSPEQGIAVREVVERVAQKLGKRFNDVCEVVDERPGQDAAYVIDSARAREKLGWQPRVDFEELVTMMVDADLAELGGAQPRATIHKAA